MMVDKNKEIQIEVFFVPKNKKKKEKKLRKYKASICSTKNSLVARSILHLNRSLVQMEPDSVVYCFLCSDNKDVPFIVVCVKIHTH